MTTRRRALPGDGGRHRQRIRRRRAPAAEDARGHVRGARGVHVADDDRGQLARREARAVQRPQIVTRQPLDNRHRSLRRPAVRMAVGIQERHQRFGRAHGGAVLVLADRRDHFAFPRFDLVLRQRRRHDDVAEQREHGVEILGEAGADEGEQVTGDADGQRDAAAVERFRDLVRRPRRRPAIDHARQEPRHARRTRRIGGGPGADRDVDRDRRRRLRVSFGR